MLPPSIRISGSATVNDTLFIIKPPPQKQMIYAMVTRVMLTAAMLGHADHGCPKCFLAVKFMLPAGA